MATGLCRLCASVRNANSLLPLSIVSRQQLIECFSIDIGQTDDTLLQLACLNCLDKLQSSYEFFIKIHESLGISNMSTSDDGAEIKPLELDDANIVETIETAIPNMLGTTEYLRNSGGSSSEEECMVSDEYDDESQDDENLIIDETSQQSCRSRDDIVIYFSPQAENSGTNNGVITVGYKFFLTSWAEVEFHCSQCEEVAERATDLYSHFCSVHGLVDFSDMPIRCMVCYKCCHNYNTLLNHIRIRHHPELALYCDACDVSFETTTELASHRRTASCSRAEILPGVRMCSQCGKCFQQERLCQAHLRYQHKKVTLYQCQHCDKTFKRIGALRIHEGIHTGTKDHVCEECGRAFRQKANLKTHVQTHLNEKNFKCAICFKTFKTPTNLEKHQKIHKNIKPFDCDYCRKKFRTKDDKLSHERMHTGEKPYKCQHCERAYRYRSALTGHMSVHTGERPYKCTMCDRDFTNWANCNKHKKRCHSDEYYGGNGVKGKRGKFEEALETMDFNMNDVE